MGGIDVRVKARGVGFLSFPEPCGGLSVVLLERGSVVHAGDVDVKRVDVDGHLLDRPGDVRDPGAGRELRDNSSGPA